MRPGMMLLTLATLLLLTAPSASAFSAQGKVSRPCDHRRDPDCDKCDMSAAQFVSTHTNTTVERCYNHFAPLVSEPTQPDESIEITPRE